MAYIDYLDLAERLNETLPYKGEKYGKIFCWVNRYDERKHGVQVCICGKFEDVAVDIKKKDMVENVRKAYDIIRDRLGIERKPIQVYLRRKGYVTV